MQLVTVVEMKHLHGLGAMQVSRHGDLDPLTIQPIVGQDYTCQKAPNSKLSLHVSGKP